MAKGDHKYRGRPSGSKNGGYTRARVQIGLEEKQMKEITKLAKANDISFTAQVRELIDSALYLQIRR